MRTEAALIVTFPTSMPAGEVSARVDRDRKLDASPTWSLQTLNLGPSRSSSDYDRHVARTVGSSYDWSDEFRFERANGRMCSLVLKTPEGGETDPRIAELWLSRPREPGLPVLDKCDLGFHIDPLDTRYLAHDASGLLAAAADLAPADSDSLRLSVAPDVDLLFHRGRYCGWILGDPVSHLGETPVPLRSVGDSTRQHELLRAYLALVKEPNIARMSEEDPALLAELRALRARAGSTDGHAALLLANGIDQVIETFYST
jgi:hypothetical protein